MLGQRRRRWPKFKTALCQRVVFAGKGVPPPPPGVLRRGRYMQRVALARSVSRWLEWTS